MTHPLTWKRLAKRLRARLLNATDAIAALARVLDKAKARTVELESEALALRERIQSLEKAEADRTCASGLAHEELHRGRGERAAAMARRMRSSSRPPPSTRSRP